MTEIVLKAFIRGQNLKEESVVDPQTRKIVSKNIERLIKFNVDFENAIYQEMSLQEFKDWFARQVIGDPYQYITCTSIYPCTKIMMRLTQEEAFSLGIIKDKQKILVKKITELNPVKFDSEMEYHLNTGWVKDVNEFGDEVLKRFPNEIEVWTGEYRRSRREVSGLDRLRTFKDDEIVEAIVSTEFNGIPCDLCDFYLSNLTGTCIGHNKVVCNGHLYGLGSRVGIQVKPNILADKEVREKLIKLFNEQRVIYHES